MEGLRYGINVPNFGEYHDPGILATLASTLGVSSQGLTWLMRRLKEERAVGAESDRRSVRYTINDEFRKTLVDCLGIVA